ncbi:MAG: DUF2914 domain-containing protein [Methylosarcina sp.]
MANKKHIVIKVKYPSPEDQAKDIKSSPEIITEWNVKRIISAVAVIILILGLALYFIGSHEENSAKSLPLSENQVHPEIKPDSVSDQAKDTEAESKSLSTFQERASTQPLPLNQSETGIVSTKPVIDKPTENNGKEKAAIESTASEKQQPAIPKNELNKKHKQNRVVRSLLAHKIINKEPVRIIDSTVKVGKTKSVWVNYFTELKGMNNKTVYHEWLNKGRIIYRQKLNISSNRWRAASRKLFNSKAAGQWRVRTVDEKGRILDQKEFKIILDH